jgi:benzodiazapine receptor
VRGLFVFENGAYTYVMKFKQTLQLIICIVVCQLAGLLGSVFTISAIPTWYAALHKPLLNPPAWLFGPVWGALYLLMGISLWLVWQSGSKEKMRAFWLFGAQLVLNAVWSPLFFGAQSIGGALAVIILLWAAIVLTILLFRKISQAAAWLLVPYIVWVSFAIYLNVAIWALN